MKTVSEVEEIMLGGPEQNFPNIFSMSAGPIFRTSVC